ncbi:helix-turn-helix transcriptional regulator [Paraburkholderia sacchari]|nr:helix-turn-helix transcriptional regulator [Paraburkholderia sacchari]
MSARADAPHVPEDFRNSSSESPYVHGSVEDFSQAKLPFEKFDELAGLIYEGPLQAVPWSGLLISLRTLLRANWVTLILRPASDKIQAVIVNAGPDGAFVERGKFATHTAFILDPFNGLPPERIISVDDFVGTDAWMSSDFYKQFVEPYDIRFMIGADLVTADGSECRLRICRPESAGNYSEQDKAVCQVLLPHLKRAIELHSRLDMIESERTLYANTVDRMLLGTVVLDETGQILRTNGVAERILHGNDGLRLANGHIEAAYSGDNRNLQSLVRNALLGAPQTVHQFGQAMSVSRPSGRAKYGLAVRTNPLNEWSEGRHRPVVTIFIRDPEQQSQASRDLVQQLFDLTPAEASLALLLAEGITLDEAAEELSIRKNTARAHLRSIFSKTGVTRQTSLVRLLLGSFTPID